MLLLSGCLLSFVAVLGIDAAKENPFSKDSKLVVVGAGPAGIHMASRLKQLDQTDAGVKVTYRQNGGAWRTEEYDFLLYTGPFAHSGRFVKDLTSAEHSIFGQLRSYVLATTLYQSDAVKDYTEPSLNAPIMYNVDKMENHTVDGTWYADRNDPSIFGDDRREHGQTRVGYQFFEKYCDFDSVLCDTDRTPDDRKQPRFVEAPKVKEKFLREMENQRVTNVKILEQFAWPYFHHFPQTGVNSGLPWDIVDLQGSQKTWWLGASASFESVHDVTNYNLMILKKYLPSPTQANKTLIIDQGLGDEPVLV